MKKRFSVTVDEDILKEFQKAAKDDSLNMSSWITKKISEYLEARKHGQSARVTR
jgi:metal-responsive CopG/Arc/MetJ family transcriptional regulator